MAKKTKKIETPIDVRETFVSIQKSFADSDLPVSEKLRTLFELQKADSKLDKIFQLRGELPLEVENLENEVRELKAKVAAVNEQIDACNEYIKTQKNEIVECDATVEKYRSQLEQIANSREYDSLNKEIENQTQHRMIAEKYIGETKEKIIAKKSEIEVLKNKTAVRSEDLKAKKLELSQIVGSTAKEEAELTAAREVCASKIDERTMTAYNTIRKSVRNHLAVVSVFNNDSCGGCFNQIPPQRLIDIASNKKMIICEYCGRILVNADFE